MSQSQPPVSVILPPSAAAEAAPDISVVIVSWNAKKYLEECLTSLSRGVRRSCEIIVVDNASTDGSPEMVAAQFPKVRLIQSGGNLGFAKGNNIAFSRARGQYLALINSDVNVFPGSIDALATYLDEHRDVGLVGPRILNADRSLQNSCRHFPGLWNKLCVVLGLSRLFPRSAFFSGEEMTWFDHASEREIDALAGCYILARRQAVEQFGQFDENFFMYGEDVDWCRRCAQSGWKVMFTPVAESIHYGGASSANEPRKFIVAFYRASLQLWAKHRRGVICLLFRCILLLHFFLRAGRELLRAALRFGWSPAGRENFQAQLGCIRLLFS